MVEQPLWLALMDTEDLNFIKRFLLASGSLKELAGEYEVTYPTIRLRLDRLIEKIRVRDEAQPDDDSFTIIVKEMALSGEISRAAVKKIIEQYKRRKGEEDDPVV